MANDDSEHKCDKLCFMCSRPNDMFLHVHLVPGMVGPPGADKGPPEPDEELVLCIPCIAGLAGGLHTPISAYVRGGYAFDAYGREQDKRNPPTPRIPLPKWLMQAFDGDNGV